MSPQASRILWFSIHQNIFTLQKVQVLMAIILQIRKRHKSEDVLYKQGKGCKTEEITFKPLLLSVLENSQKHNAMIHFHTESDRAFPAWFIFSLCRSQVSADLPKKGHVSVHIARITYISCSLSPFLAFSCFFHLISN